MYAVSARYLQAARTAHTIIPSAIHRDPFTGTTTTLEVIDGAVTDDSGSAIRRSLSLTVPNTQANWDALAAPGGEITVTKSTRYIDRMTETVPLGVFVVDQDAIGYAPGDTITLTCPDRWLLVQRNRFGAGLTRSAVPGNAVWVEIQRLTEGAWPNAAFPFPGWASYDTSVTAKVGPLIYTEDREKAVRADLAAAHSLEVFFDPTGKCVLRKVPILTTNSVPVWTVDAGEGGVQISASRTRDLSAVRNAWVVSSSASDLHLAPVEVDNTNPADPLSIYGPLGFVRGYFDSPVLRTSAALTAAGKTLLRKSLGIAQQISLEASPNDALASEDVIRVVLPQIDRTTIRPTELHMIDSVTIPLTPAGTQTIQTRSTRPPSDVEGST